MDNTKIDQVVKIWNVEEFATKHVWITTNASPSYHKSYIIIVEYDI